MKNTGKKHILEIDLTNSKSLEEAVNYINNLDIRDIVNEYVQRLVDDGTKYAFDVCPVDQGDLQRGIYSTVEPTLTGAKGQVVCTSDHVAFVEFGTGVVGSLYPYPGKEMGDYKRNVPSEHKDATGGWWYTKDDGETFHYTRGCQPNPFMWRTAEHMKSKVNDYAKGMMFK